MITLAEHQTLPLLSDYIDRYFNNIKTKQTKHCMESDLKHLELMDQAKGVETKESKDCKHYLREMLRINFPTGETNE